MSTRIRIAFIFSALILFGFAGTYNKAHADVDSVQGLYKAVLLHEKTDFYQIAHITLRTVNTGSGPLKISANVRLLFGDEATSEFLTYEFDDCPLNLLTRQISIKSEKSNISIIGKLKDGKLEGEWFSTVLGKVGKFTAEKDKEPVAPSNGILVKTLTGHYRGAIENTNPESNLPERATVSFVSTQDTTGPEPIIRVSGNMRLYLGDFGTHEYEETKFKDIQFNFFNRYLTARTEDYGLTIKGVVGHDGTFKGRIFADGLGEVADAIFERRP